MAASTLSAAGPLADIIASISYQAPESALANFCPAPSGRCSTSVRTTIRSRISPGICEELNSDVMPFCLRISETIGFHVTTALAGVARKSVGDIGIGGVHQAHALDLVAQAVDGHGAIEQVLGDGLLHQQHFLAGEILQCSPLRTSRASLPLE